MENLSPEAPHLSIAVYPSIGEDQALREVYATLCEANEVLHSRISLVPVEARFESVSDLADSLHVIDVSGANVSRLFEEKEGEGFRAVRVQLLEKTLGVVVAELSRAEPGEIHPVSVALSADVLGFPEFLWEREGGYRAFLLGEWARKTLQSICDRLDPLYGHLGVEETLPSPSGFREVCDRVRGEFYLSKRLVGVRKDFLDALTLDYGSGLVSTWHKGFFICSWPPFGGLGLSDEEARSLEVKVTKFVAEMLGVGRLGQ